MPMDYGCIIQLNNHTMPMWEAPPLPSLLTTLADPTLPVGMRMRATYYLRQVYDNYVKNNPIVREEESDDMVNINDSNNNDNSDRDLDDTSMTVLRALTVALTDTRHGSLLRHEFAYVLGQLRDVRSVHSLECTLLNVHDDTMVRIRCKSGFTLKSLKGAPRIVHVTHRCAVIFTISL